jgi:hypothetical protein
MRPLLQINRGWQQAPRCNVAAIRRVCPRRAGCARLGRKTGYGKD